MLKTKKIWWQVEFAVNAQQEDTASWLVMELGANGCQSIVHNNQIIIQAYFEQDQIQPDNLDTFYGTFKQHGLSKVIDSLKVSEIKEQDWLAEWKRSIKPIIIGEKFLVCPPWLLNTCVGQEYENRYVIILEPGLAFGTGLHATTQFCLSAIEKHVSGGNILDVGTGSGILSIAAAKFSDKSHIDALEISSSACEVARQNFKLNKVASQICLIEGSTDKVLSRRYHCILSNITYEDNVFLLSSYNDLLLPEGKIIMAGILREKLNLIMDILSFNNYEIIENNLTGEWAGLVVRPRCLQDK